MIQCGKCECIQVVFLDDKTDDLFYHPQMNMSVCEAVSQVSTLPVTVEFNFLRNAELTESGEFISGGEIVESYVDTVTSEDL